MARDQDTSGSGDNETEFEELFAQASNKARAKGASDENLDELEAFLEAFEKDPDTPSSTVHTSPAVARETEPVADFSAPEHVEALVHGLLKDDQFDLSAADKPRASQPEVPAMPVMPATPASQANSGGAQRPAPLILAAMAMSAVALLVAIGAGWASFGGREAPAVSAADPVLAADVAALKQRLAAVAARLEGPVSDITDSYPRDMDALGKRINELSVALTSVEQRLAAVSVAPTQPAKAAAKNEHPVPPVAKAVPAGENWQVNLMSFTERAGAEAELKRARAQGMNAQIVPAERDGRTWYRVAVVGFTNADAARAYVTDTAAKAGYPSAWIARP